MPRLIRSKADLGRTDSSRARGSRSLWRLLRVVARMTPDLTCDDALLQEEFRPICTRRPIGRGIGCWKKNASRRCASPRLRRLREKGRARRDSGRMQH